MLYHLRNFFERKTFLGKLARKRRYKRYEKKYMIWKNKGAILPMPHFGKYLTLQNYARLNSPKMFVETGTYKGDMTYAILNDFPKLVSIELSRGFYETAKKRFAGYSKVNLIQGQSGDLMPDILRNVDLPCMFWLDAHWSGGSTAKGDVETPIEQELKCILQHPNSKDFIILIDDAREFKGKNDYPTVDFVKNIVAGCHPDWIFEVKDDIIRTHSTKFKR